MKTAFFNAVCPFEIGDLVKDRDGKTHTITDISVVHRLKKSEVFFSYELDNSGDYVFIISCKNHTPTLSILNISSRQLNPCQVEMIANTYAVTYEDLEICANFCQNFGLHGKILSLLLQNAIEKRIKGEL